MNIIEINIRVGRDLFRQYFTPALPLAESAQGHQQEPGYKYDGEDEVNEDAEIGIFHPCYGLHGKKDYDQACRYDGQDHADETDEIKKISDKNALCSCHN